VSIQSAANSKQQPWLLNQYINTAQFTSLLVLADSGASIVTV